MLKQLKKKAVRLKKVFSKGSAKKSNMALGPDSELYSDAVNSGLFDANWYQHQHKVYFNTPEEAFSDYLRKSKFANIAPSAHFDPVSYFHNNPDVYASSMSPLQHFLRFGKGEGRVSYPLRPLWNASKEIDVSRYEHTRSGRYAVVLHIYYEDFVSKFHNAFMGVDFDFDLFITTPSDAVAAKAERLFKTNPSVKNIKIANVPNKGRNFGGFLVEFSNDLLEYDYVCHLHSKKSLYSGTEQTHWAEYLLEYLARDKQVLRNMLNIFEGDKSVGIYYPTTFWNMPQWTCHWLKNKGIGKQILGDWFDIEHKTDYFSYPAGGMFWAKTDAIRPLLEKTWSYEDFPDEPLPADGTVLHAIERILPIIADDRGYESLHFYPPTGAFTKDSNFIFLEYQYGLENRMNALCSQNEIISFDIFDTLIFRKFYEPDYAKYLLPEAADLDIEGQRFVEMRNDAEFQVRKRKKFKGDVNIEEVYQELASKNVIPHSRVNELVDLEFELDLSMIQPKEYMVEFLNRMGADGKEIYIISDTYYLQRQIEKLLSKAGVIASHTLMVSSELGLRKDNGTMWESITKTLKKSDRIGKFVHIGDNVVADSQVPGDFGLRTLHILAPKDKWQAMNMPELPELASGFDDVSEMKKWGLLVANVGSNPFL